MICLDFDEQLRAAVKMPAALNRMLPARGGVTHRRYFGRSVRAGGCIDRPQFEPLPRIEGRCSPPDGALALRSSCAFSWSFVTKDNRHESRRQAAELPSVIATDATKRLGFVHSVAPTEAPKERWLKRVDPIDRCTQPFGDAFRSIMS